MSKSTALLIGLLIISLFGGFAILWPTRTVHLNAVLTAVVSLVSAYIGLQVINNGVKGKFFNEDLYKTENGG